MEFSKVIAVKSENHGGFFKTTAKIAHPSSVNIKQKKIWIKWKSDCTLGIYIAFLCVIQNLLLCSLLHAIKNGARFWQKLGKYLQRLFLDSKKGKTVPAYLIFPVLYVYKDMHYFFLVSMSSSSSAPVNVFSWSYPAVTEHYKVFHASMRKSINQLVLRAHDTYRWHGSGFRPRSASSKLSANMKKV